MKIGINIHQRKRGVFRTLRGGSFYYDSKYTRTADRFRNGPVYRSRLNSFRIVVVRRKP